MLPEEIKVYRSTVADYFIYQQVAKTLAAKYYGASELNDTEFSREYLAARNRFEKYKKTALNTAQTKWNDIDPKYDTLLAKEGLPDANHLQSADVNELPADMQKDIHDRAESIVIEEEAAIRQKLDRDTVRDQRPGSREHERIKREEAKKDKARERIEGRNGIPRISSSEDKPILGADVLTALRDLLVADVDDAVVSMAHKAQVTFEQNYQRFF